VQTNKDWSYGAFADNGGHFQPAWQACTTESRNSVQDNIARPLSHAIHLSQLMQFSNRSHPWWV
ncbi:MAG: hypothetical protein AAGC59_06410, partial [Brucella pseudogrignonensis]